MKRSKIGHWLAVVPLATLCGCGLFSSSDKGLAQVDELVSAVERVHVDAEVSKQRSHEAMTALHSMVTPNNNLDAVLAHQQLVQAIERSEKQAGELRTSAQAMRDAAGPVFDQWQANLAQFSSEDLRRRSQARLEETRRRYEAIVTAVEPAQNAYESLNHSLRDHALFLGHDFNQEALADLEADVRALGNAANELDGRLDACRSASRAYVESAALPSHVDVARPPR